MCWVCDKIKGTIKLAEKDIKVYKVVKGADKDGCISTVYNHVYYLNIVQPEVHLNLDVIADIIFIEKGYHSYESFEIPLDSVKRDEFNQVYKTAFGGKCKMYIYSDDIRYLATFIIPKGTVYYVNNKGEIVSETIKYTGKFIEL